MKRKYIDQKCTMSKALTVSTMDLERSDQEQHHRVSLACTCTECLCSLLMWTFNLNIQSKAVITNPLCIS